MKSMRLTQLFVALGCAVVLFSCKKDDKKETVTPEVPVVTPDSTYILSKTYYYSGDSAVNAQYVDTLYYSDNRISKIASVTSYSGDSINHTFTYNAAGKLTWMNVKGTGANAVDYDQDYRLYYNADNGIDSLRKIDRGRWEDNLLFTMNYDDKKFLQSVNFYTMSNGQDVPYYALFTTFKRNAAGKLDSVVYGVGEYTYSTVAAAATDTSIQFADAFNLATSVKINFALVSGSAYPKVQFNSLLSPSDYFFRSGTHRGLPYIVNATKNGLGLLNSYSLVYTIATGTGSELNTRYTIRFEYVKVPKN